MCAFDAASEDLRRAILKAGLEKKLILLPCGPRSIRLRPALNMTRAEVDEGMRRLEETLASIA
jgi:L-lysine 6-transaminase